jgi:hypothetical protein
MRLLDAMHLVIKRRYFASPNESFRLQLAQLEVRALGQSSVAACDDKEWDFAGWNAVKGAYAGKKPAKGSRSKKGKKRGGA